MIAKPWQVNRSCSTGNITLSHLLAIEIFAYVLAISKHYLELITTKLLKNTHHFSGCFYSPIEFRDIFFENSQTAYNINLLIYIDHAITRLLSYSTVLFFLLESFGGCFTKKINTSACGLDKSNCSPHFNVYVIQRLNPICLRNFKDILLFDQTEMIVCTLLQEFDLIVFKSKDKKDFRRRFVNTLKHYLSKQKHILYVAPDSIWCNVEHTVKLRIFIYLHFVYVE